MILFFKLLSVINTFLIIFLKALASEHCIKRHLWLVFSLTYIYDLALQAVGANLTTWFASYKVEIPSQALVRKNLMFCEHSL